jgi:hypothetical protein
MSGELGTTNLLLGIMAAVSLLEAFVIIGMGIAGLVMYRRVMTLADDLEVRQVAPAMARVNAILDDVKVVTAGIHHTMDGIDDTAHRVRSNVRAKTSHVVGIVRGLRVVIEGMLRARHGGVGRR